MSPLSCSWSLLALLLAGAAAYVSQTPEPPGAVIYDRHWPYMAPGGGGGGGDGSWWWLPQRQRQLQWWRSKRSNSTATEPARTGPGPAREADQDQEQSRDQDQAQDQKQQPHWPEFLQETSPEGALSKVLSRQRRKHGRPQRWRMERLCEARNECTCYSHKTRATFCCDCQWGSCFPGEGRVMLPDGRSRRMDQLAVGDDVMTVTPAGDLVRSAVLGFLDRRPAATGEYLHLQLATGHRLRLSASHVTFTRRRPEGVFASQVQAGDQLMVAAGNRTAYSAVLSIKYFVLKGAFVPLTEHGTLLVDGVLASNYASFPHALSHALTAPFRLWPALLSEWFVVADKNVLVDGLKRLGRLVVGAPPSSVLRMTPF